MDSKEYRKIYKLTQQQFADKVGVTQAMVSFHENKKKTSYAIKAFLLNEANYRKIANYMYAKNSKPAITECKPSVNFFVRLWRWLR